MIRRGLKERIQSRVVFQAERPRLTTHQAITGDRIPAVDLTLHGVVRAAIGLEIPDLQAFETKLDFAEPRPPPTLSASIFCPASTR